jgi:hypothetical protein
VPKLPAGRQVAYVLLEPPPSLALIRPKKSGLINNKNPAIGLLADSIQRTLLIVACFTGGKKGIKL